MENLLPFSPLSFHGSVKANLDIVENNIVNLSFQWPPHWPIKAVQGGSQPMRKNELWKSTCLEAFIQPKDKQEYWEINLAPNGNWNVYEFDEYRKPLPPREALTWQLMERRHIGQTLTAQFKCDFHGSKKFRVGLCCILEMSEGEKIYWALKHPKTKPDYHDSDSFLLERDII